MKKKEHEYGAACLGFELVVRVSSHLMTAALLLSEMTPNEISFCYTSMCKLGWQSLVRSMIENKAWASRDPLPCVTTAKSPVIKRPLFWAKWTIAMSLCCQVEALPVAKRIMRLVPYPPRPSG